MKLVLVGSGSFGAGWYHLLKTAYPAIDVVVVDSNPARSDQIMDASDQFYTSLEAALTYERPDIEGTRGLLVAISNSILLLPLQPLHVSPPRFHRNGIIPTVFIRR